MKTNEEIVEEFAKMFPEFTSLDLRQATDEDLVRIVGGETPEIRHMAIDWLRTTLEAKDKACEARVREERERIYSAIEDYFIGSYPTQDANILCEYIREVLTPNNQTKV